MKFHNWYNYESVQKYRDYFYKGLADVFKVKGRIVSYDDFRYIEEELEDCFNNDRKINIDRVKDKIIN